MREDWTPCPICGTEYDGVLCHSCRNIPPEEVGPPNYANIREVLGHFIGQKLVDITQHDKEEREAGQEAYVCLMFEKGEMIQFPITDLGFSHTEEESTPEGQRPTGQT